MNLCPFLLVIFINRLSSKLDGSLDMIEIPNTVEEYRLKRSDYEELAERVEDILFEVLKLGKINYALTESRAKNIENFQAKLKDNQDDKVLYDLAGIRVVGYVKSDVEKIVKVIQNNFVVDNDKSKDKALELKPDQFGYRAIHLICTLPDTRTVLPEYKKFKDMFFEIQVKTILEHAWAQIEHDRNYKYKGLLKDIQHDFYLVAGILESADKQFDSINKRIEEYNKSISQKTEQGKLEEIEINPATLKKYILDKFGHLLKIKPSYGSNQSGESEVGELISMKIHNLHQLDGIIPENFAENAKRYTKMFDRSRDYENISSIVFSILIMGFGKESSNVLCKTRNMTQEKFNVLM